MMLMTKKGRVLFFFFFLWVDMRINLRIILRKERTAREKSFIFDGAKFEKRKYVKRSSHSFVGNHLWKRREYLFELFELPIDSILVENKLNN